MTKEIYCINFFIEEGHSQTCDKMFQSEWQNEITNAKKFMSKSYFSLVRSYKIQPRGSIAW